jgi:hypothetical protein
MKRASFMRNIGLTAMAFLSGCVKQRTEIDENGVDAVSINDTGELSGLPPATFCTSCVVDDLQRETVQEFSDVVARYRTTHHQLFNQFAKGVLDSSPHPNTGTHVGQGFQDARSCWFGLDRLKKFICLMEKYSQQLNIPSSQLGIRFYYGVYPTNYSRDINLSDKHTLFLTATQGATNPGQHEDFDPYISVTRGSVISLASLINGGIPATSEIFVQSARPANQTPPNNTLNQGDLCPPGSGCLPTLQAIDLSNPIKPLGI